MERDAKIEKLIGVGCEASKVRELDDARLDVALAEEGRRGAMSCTRKVVSLHEEMMKERKKGQVKKKPPSQTARGILQAFDVFDKDGNRTIDKDEFLEVRPLSAHRDLPRLPASVRRVQCMARRLGGPSLSLHRGMGVHAGDDAPWLPLGQRPDGAHLVTRPGRDDL
jgi:hypothetical protein